MTSQTRIFSQAVGDHMGPTPPCLAGDASVSELLGALARAKATCALVTDEAGRLAGARDLQHFVRRQEGPLSLPRWMGEGAIVADVAAQMGERNEHLARIALHGAMPAKVTDAGDQAATARMRVSYPAARSASGNSE